MILVNQLLVISATLSIMIIVIVEEFGYVR